MKALDKLKDISKILVAHNIEFPEKEAEIILESVLEISLVSVYRDNPELTPDQTKKINQIVTKRIDREPLQYILGNIDFMGMKLHVGPGVLIPRPETELMVEYAVKTVSGSKLQTPDSKLLFLDLCTGSGCLALALAKGFPDAMVYGVDISETALSYARRNADLNNIANVTFLQGNLFEPFTKLLTPNSKLFAFDLIISNPPYIKTADIKNLQPEIRDWEPVTALDGGIDGLDHYRTIISAATNFLKDNGMLILELGIEYAEAVQEMFKESGYPEIELIKDYAGIDRIAAGKWDTLVTKR